MLTGLAGGSPDAQFLAARIDPRLHAPGLRVLRARLRTVEPGPRLVDAAVPSVDFPDEVLGLRALLARRRLRERLESRARRLVVLALLDGSLAVPRDPRAVEVEPGPLPLRVRARAVADFGRAQQRGVGDVEVGGPGPRTGDRAADPLRILGMGEVRREGAVAAVRAHPEREQIRIRAEAVRLEVEVGVSRAVAAQFGGEELLRAQRASRLDRDVVVTPILALPQRLRRIRPGPRAPVLPRLHLRLRLIRLLRSLRPAARHEEQEQPGPDRSCRFGDSRGDAPAPSTAPSRCTCGGR